ncbi:MAG: Spi family protease inhibitor, partial [Cyclobacteriaceae bacterium]|nr:Spi family protease inhibitor [Cyclobacteriaceae bacterium]
PPPALLLIVATIVALSRCSDVAEVDKKPDQPNLTEAEIKRLVLLDDDYVYPLEQTKANAMNLAAKFLDDKDGIKRSISKLITIPSRYSIEKKTLIKTDFSIAKPETPSLYIANFNEKDGYVILSADKRVPEIVAIVGSGTIDSLAHPGLRVFLSNAIMHMDEMVAEMESFRNDVAFRSMVAKLGEALTKEKEKTSKNGRTSIECHYLRIPGARTNMNCPGRGGCSYYTSTVPIQSVSTTTYIAPILLTTLWEQGPPFNNGQPNGGCNTSSYYCGTNSKYKAGCVAIAESQVVAYFYSKQNPFWQSITGKTCSSFSAAESQAVASLNHSIYLDYGIYVDRSCASTAAGFQIGDLQFTNPRGISPGYGLVQGEWRSWNTGDIRNSLSNGSPVIIQGKQHLCCFIWCWGCGSGHQWVIDGMRDLGIQTTYQFIAYYQGDDCPSNKVTYYTYSINSTTNTQIHQNWGWGPENGSGPNDWYAQNYFGDYNHANYIVAYITAN